MLEKIQKYMEQNKMLYEGDSIFAGVSGGADSVCLLLVLKEMQSIIGFSLYAVHINHGIRGEESMRDENFTRELCEKIGVGLKVVHVDVPALSLKWKMSFEEAGRKARYDVFEELSAGAKNGKTAVAHHMDDQSETVLMNIFRGSGIKGVCGIQPVRGNIIRPLLCVRRQEIEEYLRKEHQVFVNDSSNFSNEYMRNRIRNKVIPYIESHINNRAVENISAMSEFLSSAESYISNQAKRAEAECTNIKDGNIYIKLDIFSEQDNIIKRYVVRNLLGKMSGKLKDIYRIHVDTVLELEHKGAGSHCDLAYRVKADRTYDSIRLHREEGAASDVAVKDTDAELNTSIELEMLSGGGKTFIPMGGMWYFENVFQEIRGIKLCIFTNEQAEKENTVKKMIGNSYTKLFDYDKIEFTLNLRTRRSGDILQIDSMGGNKKLKDYFIDKKIPSEYRDRVPVIASGSEILWIMGLRMSEKYKVSEKSTKILKIDICTED